MAPFLIHDQITCPLSTCHLDPHLHLHVTAKPLIGCQNRKAFGIAFIDIRMHRLNY